MDTKFIRFSAGLIGLVRESTNMSAEFCKNSCCYANNNYAKYYSCQKVKKIHNVQ